MELLIRKGHDYSGDDDCLRNFRDFGWFGILVRLSDKFSRLKNLAKDNRPRVGDESLLDTLRDIRNYAFLMQVVYEEEQPVPPSAFARAMADATESMRVIGRKAVDDLEHFRRSKRRKHEKTAP